MRNEVRYHLLRDSLLLGCLVGFTACQGGSPDGQSPVDEEGPAPPLNNGPTADKACGADEGLIPARALRLTARQYQRTLAETFALSMGADELPPDGFTNDGLVSFDTYSPGLGVSDAHALTFRKVATAVGDKLLPEVKQKHSCVIGSNPGSDCAGDFIRDYGARAFRRDLNDDELNRARGYFNESATKWGGEVAARLVLQALLISPSHIYRTEFGTKQSDAANLLTGSEVANQLAYVLTDGPPDEELMKKAREGALTDSEIRRSEAARLLDGAHGREKVAEFFNQFFDLEHINAVTKNAQAFPNFGPQLRADMLNESKALVQTSVFDDKRGLAALFAADTTRISGRLARHYGLDAAGAGDNDTKTVKLPPARRGILTHGSLLASTSPEDRTSTTERGVFISTRFLCRSIPSAPAGAQQQAGGKIYAPNEDFTQREHWEFALKTAPECTSCHGQFVPLGLGLENFDAVGRYRSKEFGKDIDTTVELAGFENELDGTYKDTAELVAKVISTDVGAACFMRHARGFLLAQQPEGGAEASCRNKALGRFLLQNNMDLRATLLEMVASPAFVLRKREN